MADQGSRFYFPVNRILFGIAVVAIGYFWQDNNSRVALSFEGGQKLIGSVGSKITHNKMAQKLIGEKNIEKMNQKISQSMGAKPGAGGPAPAGNLAAAEGASGSAQVATESDFKSGRFVQIQGQYYRYRDDNVYYINGQRVFYQNNRKAEPVAATPTNENITDRSAAAAERQ